MKLILRGGSLLALLASSLVLTASANAAPITLKGTVGPGFTISVTMNGKPVKTLKAGKTYRLIVSDRASIHDFHLSGPGFNKVITSDPFIGTKTVLLKLQKGTYKFRCDPHASVMHGSFRAV
jgi:plastocyanin